MMTEHRYANTPAATMLGIGLRSAAQERGISLREIGRRLGYRQPVVLSHMASGRVPIPIDRALAIAEQVGLPGDRFLEAVLNQHHPSVEWRLITNKGPKEIWDLEAAVGKEISGLSPAHQRILREVAADLRPEERWISPDEVAAVKFMRDLFPNMRRRGLSKEDRDALRLAASLTNGVKPTPNDQHLSKSDDDEI